MQINTVQEFSEWYFKYPTDQPTEILIGGTETNFISVTRGALMTALSSATRNAKMRWEIYGSTVRIYQINKEPGRKSKESPDIPVDA